MKKILLALFIITLIGLVSAQTETIGPYDLNDCIVLKQTCSNCSYSNISSVVAPNNTEVLSNQVMTTINNVEYQYSCLIVDKRGTYTINGYSDVDGERTVWAYDLIVGSNIWLWLSLICLAGFFLIMSIFGNTEFFLFISGSLFVLSGIFGMIYGISTFNEMYTRGISFVTIGIGLLLILGAYLDFGNYGGNEQDDED